MKTIINKMINGIQLTGGEVEKAVWNLQEVKTIKGENNRWSQSCEIILKVEGKLYSLEYDRGLTENQENEYYPQIAEEVAEVEETIKVKKFVGIEKAKQFEYKEMGEKQKLTLLIKNMNLNLENIQNQINLLKNELENIEELEELLKL